MPGGASRVGPHEAGGASDLDPDRSDFMTLSLLITVVLVLVVLGVVLYLVETYIPMDPPIKVVIRVVIVIALCLYLLNLVGIWSGAGVR